MTLAVDSVEAVQEAVRAGPRVLPVGGGTKPALSTPPADDVIALDLSSLRGLVEYDPAELTLTALAGTPVADLDEALAVHGQHLPFDPPLSAAGATLGGVVAAGTSGPGAFRHGGVRDFVIGVRFVDGTRPARRGRWQGGQERRRVRPAQAPGRLDGPPRRHRAALAQGLPASARDHDPRRSTSAAPRPRSTPWRGSAAGRWTSTRWTSIRRRACSCASAATPTPSRRAPPASPTTVPAAGRAARRRGGRGALARRRRARVGAVDEPGGPRGADGPVGPRPRGGARGRRRAGPLQPRRERRLDRLARGAPARGARRGAGRARPGRRWS